MTDKPSSAQMEIDQQKAEKALAEKKEKVAELLDEADLPPLLVTDYLKDQLLRLDEEGMKEAVEEREGIAKKLKGIYKR